MSFQSSNLKNGSTLITVETPGLLSVTLMVLVRSGPMFDPPEKTGLSHFVEHMLFKGTEKYPSSKILSHSLEKHGSILESFSYQENNSYWAKVPKDSISIAVDLLTQQLQYSLFRLKDIKNEKNVVKEELKMVKSNPSSYIWELWAENVWNCSPLGRIYTGSVTSINSFTKSDVLNFIKKNYTVENTVFVACGNIKHGKMKLLLEKYLVNYSNNSNSQVINKVEHVRKNPIRVVNDNADVVTVAYGFLTTSRLDPDSYALELIEYLLGRGMGSKLNQKIVEAGLTYSITTYTRHLSNTGYFLINFTADPRNLNLILEIINKQLMKIRRGQFSEEELERAKGYYIGQLSINNETTDDLASWYGYQAICDMKSIVAPEKKRGIMEKITKNKIINVAKKFFRDDNWYLSALGPIKRNDIKVNIQRSNN